MIYFRSLSDNVGDEEAVDEDVVDGEVFDDSIFYTLFSGGADEVTDEVDLEKVSGDDTVPSDEVSDGGEIVYFGGEPDGSEIFETTSDPFISEWYNQDNPLDTNIDGETTSIDALIVFNSLTQLGAVLLSQALFAQSPFTATSDLDNNFRVDSNNDGHLSPVDALMRLVFLSQSDATDESADLNPDAVADEGRLGDFASILPGEWDQYESTDEIVVEEPDAGDDQSTDVFGSRLRDPNIDWPEDELGDEPIDGEADDEFWSKYAGDPSDTLLDEETLDFLARA